MPITRFTSRYPIITSQSSQVNSMFSLPCGIVYLTKLLLRGAQTLDRRRSLKVGPPLEWGSEVDQRIRLNAELLPRGVIAPHRRSDEFPRQNLSCLLVISGCGWPVP